MRLPITEKLTFCWAFVHAISYDDIWMECVTCFLFRKNSKICFIGEQNTRIHVGFYSCLQHCKLLKTDFEGRSFMEITTFQQRWEDGCGSVAMNLAFCKQLIMDAIFSAICFLWSRFCTLLLMLRCKRCIGIASSGSNYNGAFRHRFTAQRKCPRKRLRNLNL